MDNKERFSEQLKLYGSFGLIYDFSSIKYLINKGYSGQGKYTPNILQLPYWDNTIVLVEAGLRPGDPNKIPDEAEKVINEWLKNKYSLTVLQGLILDEMRELGFFISEKTAEDLDSLVQKNIKNKTFVEMVLSQEIDIALKQAKMLTSV